MNTSFTIKTWAEDDRPREKFMLKGQKSLSDAELLAILIGSGTKEKSAVELSQELLSHSGNNLKEFSRKTMGELCKFKGIGAAKALTIMAALELGRRRKSTYSPRKEKATSSKIIYEYAQPLFEDLNFEEFHILLVNRANEITKSIKISQGGIASTVVDGRLVFKAALDAMASGIILCHNHPSGQLLPSPQDMRLTKDLFCFGKMIDLPILDHLIFTDNGYFSFADHGML